MIDIVFYQRHLIVVAGDVASCWVESIVGVAALENLSASSSKRVIRRFSSASGERDLAQGRCSEVTWRSVIMVTMVITCIYHNEHTQCLVNNPCIIYYSTIVYATF